MILPVLQIKEELLTYLKDIDLSNLKGQNLISFAFKLKDIDLHLIVDSIIKENKKVFYFNRPEKELVLLAFNELYSIKTSQDNRFSLLRSKIADVTANSLNNFDEDMHQDFPLFFGGTKFCSINNSDEWKEFEDNDWFIPKFLFYIKGAEKYFIINLLINKTKIIESYVDNTSIQIDQLNKIECKSGIEKQTAALKLNRNGNDFSEWNILVKNSLDKIRSGLFRKVVLSRRLIANIVNSPVYHVILQQLKNNYRNCNIFLFKSGDSVLFGATPEQLLKYRNNEIEFDALAGSAKRGVTVEEDNMIAVNLLQDKKNGIEHNQVIDFIKDVSLPYIKEFRQSETIIKKFTNIQHIYTPIKGTLKSEDQIYELVEDIFPTPAICGSPKCAALEYISQNEKFDRGMFSGIVGFISRDEMDFSVAIRSALLTQNKLFIYAGCGIVEGSDPQSEFEETEIKMKPILSLFRNED